MSNLLRVAVIDSHPLFREAVVSKLKSAGGMEVVGGVRLRRMRAGSRRNRLQTSSCSRCSY
jgi:hypothetical protein